MQGNERIQRFLELQSKNIKFDDISKELGVASKTLRTFLNKKGYKFEEGVYKFKENNNEINQIEFNDLNKKSTSKAAKSTKSKNAKAEENSTKDTVKVVSKKTVSKQSIKKDRKINITQEDLDKLCEVYDWYLEVKDNKSIKPKKTSNKKDIRLDEINKDDFKSTSIKIEKQTWEEFERLCSNSQYTKQEIITQALKDFMKEYKYLL